jgi:hypothetical protein
MSLAVTMTDVERLNFVAACDLGDYPQAEPLSGLEVPEAAVVGSSVIAFTEGVSRQNKDDIMNSFLFATLVANKKYNPESDSQAWYGEFHNVLSTVGWLSSNWSYSRYRATQSSFSMDEVGLEIIGSAITAAALGPAGPIMLKVATDAIAALKAKNEPWRLFERKTKSHQGGSFRIAACSESTDGTVNVVMGAVKFRAESSVTDVLFFEWKSAEVETYKGEDSLVLNTNVYSRVREAVLMKLGDNAEDAIAEFEI